jgi:hypothetical protein
MYIRQAIKYIKHVILLECVHAVKHSLFTDTVGVVPPLDMSPETSRSIFTFSNGWRAYLTRCILELLDMKKMFTMRTLLTVDY